MKKKALLSWLLAGMMIPVSATPQKEKLDRGVIAVKTTTGAFVSWRSLTEDDPSMTFDVYRDGVKVNAEPITDGTNYSDTGAKSTAKYVIKALVGNEVVETSSEIAVSTMPYKRLKLQRPKGSTSPDNVSYTYTPNDCSVGDVDGDGRYEIFVKWNPSNSHDNSEGGYTGNVYIDCYTLDGEQLWRIDLGQNIRAGAHYTQFMVYDFDGDGKAEMACKTAPGTIDGQGKAVLMGTDKVTDDYRSSKSGSSKGQVISGPEYLTMFNGLTGAEITTVSYEPLRTVRTSSQWGDSYGGRCERYLGCVAYLDGEHPSLVMCRGYYTAAYLCAWDFDGTSLTKRWLHKSETPGEGAYAEGAHSLTVGDVDNDGCDEIVYGSACIDHNGSLLYRTGAGHGDALHLGDFDPDREGLEVFMVHEERKKLWDCEFRDARTGEIIWGVKNSGNDIGRGLVGDISENWRGYEIWPGARYIDSSTREDVTFDCRGNIVSEKRASTNFRIYWDGDLLDELFDGSYNSETKTSSPSVTKRNATATGNSATWSFANYNAQSCNTTKATPCLQADILGDWREELILWDGSNSTDLLIFTTSIPTKYRIPCLMQDHNYRMAIAWQNTGYNQPPHLGFYLPDRYSTDARISVSAGHLTQTVEIGYRIETIEGSWEKATNITATGLPEGVTLTTDPDTKTFTITGKPTTVGTYPFTLSTEGGDPNANVEGTITVGSKIDLEKVAYFTFDELSGSTVRNEVEGEATFHGTPILTDGYSGTAISLDGNNDYLTQEAYSAMQLGTQDFTIEMWFRSTDDAAYIFHKGSIAENSATGASGKWIGIEYKNGDIKFAIDDNTVKSEAKAAATPLFNGQWSHMVCVRESSSKTLKIYMNGALMAEAADNTGNISDNNELMVIGNVNTNFDNFFAGEIDEFTIYTGAMSANRVAERYYGESGIESTAPTTDMQPARLTLVNAGTGMVVARGIGDSTNVTAGIAQGIYILVTEQGNSREIKKIAIR